MLKETTSKDDDLLGLLVHSYNNHLAAMMGYTELTLLDNTDKTLEEKLHLILTSGSEAVELGKSVLATIGRLQVTWSSISLVSMIADLEEALETKLDGTRPIDPAIKIETNIDWFIESIKDLNDFVKEHSHIDKTNISLESSVAQQGFQIRVDSNGLELSKGVIEQLFYPFYSSRQIQGTKGLGLARAKGFFGQMQAKLEWQNDLGFILHLPLINCD